MNTIWILDDEPGMRWVLEKALDKAGWPVRSFADGAALKEALDALEGAADPRAPAVLVSDIRMPGPDGLTVLSAVRARLQSERVPGTGLQEVQVRLLVERGLRAVDGGFVWRSDPRLVQPTLIRMTQAQIDDVLRAIECPTLALFADPAQPYLPDGERRRRVALLPHARLAVLPGGHHLHMQQPEAVAQGLGEFLGVG